MNLGVPNRNCFDFKNVEQTMEVFALANEGFIVPKREQIVGKLKTTSPTPKRNWLALVLGSLLLMMVSYWLITSQLVTQNLASELPADIRQKKLAVMIFENQTGEQALDVVGKMASDWVAQGLMQIEEVSIVTPATVSDKVAVGGLRAMKDLAVDNGVQYVFSGNYYLDGNQLIIKSKLVNAQTEEVEYYLADYQSAKDQPLIAVKELTERIMGYWLNKEEIEKRKTTPPKYEAYKALLKGKESYSFNHEASIKYMNQAPFTSSLSP